jgi:WD40 repeat protein
MRIPDLFITLMRSTTCITGVALLAAGILPAQAKVKEFGRRLTIRPVTIRSISYNHTGDIFAIPNFVSAGSVALFWVNKEGTIAPVPSRLSENDFVRSAGLFYLKKKRAEDPHMAFIALPELLSGYSACFTEESNTLVIAGGKTVTIYKKNEHWELDKSLEVGTSVSRAVFSPDESRLAVLSEGKCFLFNAATFSLIETIEPKKECGFKDVTFSHDSRKCALFEFRSIMLDYGSRVRIYYSDRGNHDRDLPYFETRPSSEPGNNLPLLSFSPGDTAIAVSVPTAFTGKTYYITSNDGSVLKEFKGICHAFSPDGTLFAVYGKIYNLKTWTVLGKFSRSTRVCAFSPTERVLITVTQDAVRRYRIEQ